MIVQEVSLVRAFQDDEVKFGLLGGEGFESLQIQALPNLCQDTKKGSAVSIEQQNAHRLISEVLALTSIFLECKLSASSGLAKSTKKGSFSQAMTLPSGEAIPSARLKL